jgi:hypothetical protein
MCVLKKCYYKYITKGLYTFFGLHPPKGKRVWFYAPPVRFLDLSEMFCLFRYAWCMICLLLAYRWSCCAGRVFVMAWCRVNVMIWRCVTSSRCIRSGVVCGAVPCAVIWSVPCAVSGLLCAAVAVCRADTCWDPLRGRCRCRYITVADTPRGATRGACIATRIALTDWVRGDPDNIYEPKIYIR